MVGSLTDRRADGRSVFLLQGAETPEEEAEMERVREWIGARYAIEGTVDVDGSLHRGSPDAPALRMLVVGRRRPEELDAAPEAALPRRDVYDFGALRTGTARLGRQRAGPESVVSGKRCE